MNRIDPDCRDARDIANLAYHLPFYGGMYVCVAEQLTPRPLDPEVRVSSLARRVVP